MSILPVIRAWRGDCHQVVANLEAALALEGGKPLDADCLLSVDSDVELAPLNEAAMKLFRTVWHLKTAPSSDTTWPLAANRAWQDTARYIHEHRASLKASGWLWWESDAMPLRRGWLTTLSEAHAARPRTVFAGHVTSDSTTPFYVPGGCALWPMDIVDQLANCAALYVSAYVFDREAGATVSRSCKRLNHLMAHERKALGGSRGRSFTQAHLKELLAINPQAVFYHGSADGSLAALLSGKPLPSQPLLQARTGLAPAYTISVLCLDNLHLTKRCLDSIIAHSADYELIVTDNGSSDGTARYLKQLKRHLGDRLTIVTNATNLGFQEPNQLALAQARGTHFVLFNNDMEACAGWLDALHQPFAERPRLAITGLAGTCCAIDASLNGMPGDDAAPEYIEGGCLMIPTALARQHGLFSSYLKFAYWEDTDLSLRLRELGYDIATVALPIRHASRGSTSRLLDLKAVMDANRREMTTRWRFYWERRTFARTVLVNRRGARGDVLMLTPALHALRTKWPLAHITVATDCPEMLTGLDSVDATATVASASPRAYDHAYQLDLTYEALPGVHITQAYADALGVTLPPKWRIEMAATPADLAWGCTVARGLRVALIHAGLSTWPGKQWPLDRFEAVTTWLRSQGWFTIAVGASDSPLAGCDDTVAGATTPQQLYALCQHAALFVGIDSMPQHVASAALLPSVILYGTTNPACIVNPSAQVRVVQADTTVAPCAGEHGRRTRAITRAPDCKGTCMAAISVDMVLSAIKEATQ